MGGYFSTDMQGHHEAGPSFERAPSRGAASAFGGPARRASGSAGNVWNSTGTAFGAQQARGVAAELRATGAAAGGEAAGQEAVGAAGPQAAAPEMERASSTLAIETGEQVAQVISLAEAAAKVGF